MKKLSLLLIFTLFCFYTNGQLLSESLFKKPPKETRPKTWMHAMSGNMTKAGLTKDLEAMAEVGLGGLLLFNITQGIPNGPVKYNSPLHHEMLTHAAKEAERLGLSFGVHNCDGWSSSGGPWISPENSMKMICWTEKVVNNIGIKSIIMPQPTAREGFYKDIKVFAYPSLASEIADDQNAPTLSSSDANFNLKLISDQKTDAELKIKGTKPWIQFSYKEPQSISSIYLIFNDRQGEAKILTSDDGQSFKLAYTPRKVRTGKGEWAINDNFPAIKSKYFRVELSDNMTLKELALLSTYKIDNPLGRTAIARTEDVDLGSIGSPTADMIIDPKQVIDISSKMASDGKIDLDLPPGNWTILRVGYTSTSATNNPASKEGKGLEVDKLSRPAFKIHYDAFVKKVIDNAKPIAPNALQYIEIDSYEMGGQNWTEEFDSIFEKEYGYSILPFLPLITGKFMESAEASEAVLADYRSLICDLMTENYFGYFQELCHADGLKTYIEPYGFGPLNDLDVSKKADMVMGEFWMNRPITQVESAASGAHIYGKKIVSAESFTAEPQINWKGHPAIAKLSGDRAWSVGVNEFMFHRFAHQANTHVLPGMTMNRWGSHFDRTQTWWNTAGTAWFEYIARGSYLLQQGVPVSDLLIFVGDGAPNATFGRKDFKEAIPFGINYDNVNTDVLLNRIKVKNGQLVLPEGTCYKALVLKNSKSIKLKTLQRLAFFAKNGIPIIGPKPQKLLGYAVSDESKREFELLINEIWNSPKTYSDYNWKKVFTEQNIKEDLKIGEQPNFEFTHRRINSDDLYFIFNEDTLSSKTLHVKFNVINKHPELWNPMDGKITRLINYETNENYAEIAITLNPQESVFVIFRDIGNQTPLRVSSTNENLKLSIDGNSAIIASIAKSGTYELNLSNGKKWKKNIKTFSPNLNLENEWKLKFDAYYGLDSTISLAKLIDWKDIPDEKIKYYSGTATYTSNFQLPKKTALKNQSFLLDLGTVNVVAKVIVNGQVCGISWMPPFVVDISKGIKSGNNNLEIIVANQWSNKLIGDERFPANNGGYELQGYSPDKSMPSWYSNNEPLPAGKRTTFTTASFYKVNDPLMPSGLVGPVKIKFEKIIKIKP